MIKAIVCCDMMGNIGKDNNLLFHIPQDMKFFREKTMNNTVLMGYNTYLSMGSKPLPNRKNIVLADRYKKIEPHDNLIVTEDMNTVVGECLGNGEEIWVIGGAYVYNNTISLEMVDEVYVTFVPTVVENADTRIDIELLATKYSRAEKVKDFIDGMVNYIELQNYIGVHAFVPLKCNDNLPAYYARNRKFEKRVDWRDATDKEWQDARWGNPYELARQGLLPDKTLIFGHFHTSYPRAKYEGQEEFGPDADFSPYYGDGYIAIDGCVAAYNGQINVIVLEDDFFEGE